MGSEDQRHRTPERQEGTITLQAPDGLDTLQDTEDPVWEDLPLHLLEVQGMDMVVIHLRVHHHHLAHYPQVIHLLQDLPHMVHPAMGHSHPRDSSH